MEKQDIVKLSKQLLSQPVPGIYFLYGGEEFLKRRFLSDLRKTVVPDDVADLNYAVVSGPDQADKVLEIAYTLPQFSDSRMIVWYNSGFPLPQQRYKKKIEDTVDTVKDFPYLYLMIYATEDEFDPLGKDGRAALQRPELRTLGFEKLPPERVLGWVRRHFEAEKLEISEDDARYLIGRAGTGMTELSSSIEKLCAYAAEKGAGSVGRADIDELVAQKLEFSAFFISDNIRSRDPSALLAYVRDAKSRAEKPQVILGTMISEAEKLYRIKLAQKNGMNYQSAAKQLGLNEYVVKLAFRSVSEVPEKRVQRFLDACSEADKKLKTSSSDAWGTLIQLVCSI
ncbi:MAG: DNA polymerase III subunit delta [Clostridia bacterium]|nr:DNA polymerase III subunit delta [Clostridia bacterium]